MTRDGQAAEGPAVGRRGAVVVFGGHMTDAPGRSVPRFPADRERAVASEIGGALAGWAIGPGDLCLCGGARGGDILFAEACLARGARVRLLLALPAAAFITRSVRGAGGTWEARFRVLLDRCEVHQLDERTGSPTGSESVFARLNAWLVGLADAAARPASPRVLLVWDRRPNPRGAAGGTADLASRARALGWPLRIIDPLLS